MQEDFSNLVRDKKWCPGCEQFVDRSEFSASKRYKDGLQTYCKTCDQSAFQSWRERNIQSAAHKKRERERSRTYGITQEQYERLVWSQEGRCAICGIEPTKLVIDHDHDTGAVRGLLCHACNLGLGLFRDDSAKLEAAIAYLHLHGR